MNTKIFNDDKVNIHADVERFTKNIRLYLAISRGDEYLHVAQPITLEKIEHHAVTSPFLTLKNNEAQELMDELWHCGLRPSEGTGSAGSLAATERHLKDMQAITKGVLKKMGVEV